MVVAPQRVVGYIILCGRETRGLRGSRTVLYVFRVIYIACACIASVIRGVHGDKEKINHCVTTINLGMIPLRTEAGCGESAEAALSARAHQ